MKEIRFTPRYREMPFSTSIFRAPEDWIFVKVLPDGVVDEKTFFVFKELQAEADKFKKAKD